MELKAGEIVKSEDGSQMAKVLSVDDERKVAFAEWLTENEGHAAGETFVINLKKEIKWRPF